MAGDYCHNSVLSEAPGVQTSVGDALRKKVFTFTGIRIHAASTVADACTTFFWECWFDTHFGLEPTDLCHCDNRHPRRQAVARSVGARCRVFSGLLPLAEQQQRARYEKGSATRFRDSSSVHSSMLANVTTSEKALAESMLIQMTKPPEIVSIRYRSSPTPEQHH